MPYIQNISSSASSCIRDTKHIIWLTFYGAQDAFKIYLASTAYMKKKKFHRHQLTSYSQVHGIFPRCLMAIPTYIVDLPLNHSFAFFFNLYIFLYYFQIVNTINLNARISNCMGLSRSDCTVYAHMFSVIK